MRRGCAAKKAPRQPLCSSAAGASEPRPSEPSEQNTAQGKNETNANSQKPGVLQKLRNFFFGERITRNKLASLGLAALLSYGFVSNINANTLVIISWVSYAKAQGASPLAQGMWKGFLASYAALYAVVGNALRPVRFSISAAIYPFFDRLVMRIQNGLNIKRRYAVGITVFLVNVCGSISYLVLGLTFACAVTGAPLLPR